MRQEKPAASQSLKAKVLQQLYATLVLDVGKNKADQLISEARSAHALLSPPTEEQVLHGQEVSFAIIDDVLDQMK